MVVSMILGIKLTCSIFISSHDLFYQIFLHIKKGMKLHQVSVMKMIKEDY